MILEGQSSPTRLQRGSCLARISHRRLWGSPWRRHSCLPRPHSWGRSWFDTVSHPERGSRRVSARQVRVPAPRRLMSCEKCGLAGQFEVGRRRGTGIRNSRLSLPSLLAADVGVKIRGIHSEIGPVLHEGHPGHGESSERHLAHWNRPGWGAPCSHTAPLWGFGR
jgi:hypothetical protein